MCGVVYVGEPQANSISIYILTCTHDCVVLPNTRTVSRRALLSNLETSFQTNTKTIAPQNRHTEDSPLGIASVNPSHPRLPMTGIYYHRPWTIQDAETWELALYNLRRCFRTTRNAQPRASPKETQQHRYEDVSWQPVMIRSRNAGNIRSVFCFNSIIPFTNAKIGHVKGLLVATLMLESEGSGSVCFYCNRNGYSINLQKISGNCPLHSFTCSNCMNVFQSHALSIRHTVLFPGK